VVLTLERGVRSSAERGCGNGLEKLKRVEAEIASGRRAILNGGGERKLPVAWVTEKVLSCVMMIKTNRLGKLRGQKRG